MTLGFLQTFGFSISALLIGVIDYAFYILLGVIFASILFSWFPGYPSNRFMQIIYDAVRNIADPILMPIRSRIPPLRLGGFALDLSPIIAILGLSIGRRILEIVIAIFVQPVVG